jgi:hypothetical protein
MPDLNFAVIGSDAPPYIAVPTVLFKLRITNANEEEQIQNINLKSQIMLAVTLRRYNADEKAKLYELFGEPERWGETLRAFLWTHVTSVVPRFTGSTVVELPVPCTYDFEVVSTKYFNALEEGDIPLTFLFSGTIFYQGESGNLQIEQISWSKEASYRLPVATWKAAMENHFPNSAWIRLRKDLFDQLYRYKMRSGLLTWDDVLERLLRASSEEVQR